MTALFSPPLALLLVPALSTAQPSTARALTYGDPQHPVTFANDRQSPRVRAVHPAVQFRVDGFNVIGTTTGGHMAFVVHMVPGGAIQRLIDQAVNPLQFTADPYLPVSISMSRPGPNPAFAIDNEAGIQAGESFMAEHGSEYARHRASMQAGSVHDSAETNHG